MKLIDRFEAKIARCPMSGCWLWTGCVVSRGYGNITIAGKTMYAHRLSWELHVGPIPDGQCVLHRCDTPACVRPDHLFLGTKKDNAADRDFKGRQAFAEKNGHYTRPERTPRGERCWKAKLTDADVIAIRADKRRGREIAKEYGIGDSSVSAIRNFKTWRHLKA